MAISTKLQYTTLTEILNDINREGGFSITVLTDDNGLPLAASQEKDDTSEVQSAVVAQVQKVVQRVHNHLDMAAPEEISLNDIHGKRLVCRSFITADNNVILAVLIPSRDKSYRKLMNRAIREIHKIWDE